MEPALLSTQPDTEEPPTPNPDNGDPWATDGAGGPSSQMTLNSSITSQGLAGIDLSQSQRFGASQALASSQQQQQADVEASAAVAGGGGGGSAVLPPAFDGAGVGMVEGDGVVPTADAAIRPADTAEANATAAVPAATKATDGAPEQESGAGAVVGSQPPHSSSPACDSPGDGIGEEDVPQCEACPVTKIWLLRGPTDVLSRAEDALLHDIVMKGARLVTADVGSAALGACGTVVGGQVPSAPPCLWKRVCELYIHGQTKEGDVGAKRLYVMTLSECPGKFYTVAGNAIIEADAAVRPQLKSMAGYTLRQTTAVEGRTFTFSDFAFHIGKVIQSGVVKAVALELEALAVEDPVVGFSYLTSLFEQIGLPPAVRSNAASVESFNEAVPLPARYSRLHTVYQYLDILSQALTGS